ncbi:hypothetical protein GCM10010207_16650 [Streptomyces atratus]|nr:hypothetical protein GCM10010207_16650 [Streptomyces atratus]
MEVARTRPGSSTPAPHENFGGAAVHPHGPNGVLWRALGPDSHVGVRDLREGAEGGTRSGGATASHGDWPHGVTNGHFVLHNRSPCHTGDQGLTPDTPGNTAMLWQAAPGQATLD